MQVPNSFSTQNSSIEFSLKTSQVFQKDSTKQKKRKFLLKKSTNRVPLLLNYSFVFKIGQSLIVNQRALKQDHGSSQSFMTSIFYFKSIQTVKLNPFYVSLGLKQTQNNQFPLSYYTERFRSFGDLEFFQLANTLEMLDLELSSRIQKLQTQTEKQQTKQKMRSELQTLLESKKGKKIVCFYSQPNQNNLTMNRIVISSELLNELGYPAEEISKEFLKYRHVFFEIFDSSFYRQIVKNASQRLKSHKAGQADHKSEEIFYDYMVRVREEQKGHFQEKIKAKIKFSRPHCNISLYEIEQMDSNTIIERTLKKSIKDEPSIIQWQERLINSEMAILKKVEYKNLEHAALL